MPVKRKRRLIDLEVFEEQNAELMSRAVERLAYVHIDEEGHAKIAGRVHTFEPGAEMWALEDGSILLRRSDGRPLWDEFDV